MSTSATKWQQWQDWLKVADKDFTQILIRKQMWEQFNQMIRDAPEDGVLKTYGAPFATWIVGMYGDSQAVAVRRQCNLRPDVITLRRIITDMKDNHNVVTHYSKNPRTVSELENELQQLEQLSETLIQFVNKRIAHWDHLDKKYNVTFGDLNQSIKQLGVLLQECHSILHNAHMDLEVVDASGWQEIFRHPWLPDSEF